MATKIAWCDETINPVVGCSKVSEGCRNCYAEKMARRLACMRYAQYQDVIGIERNGNIKGEWNGSTAFVPAELEKPFGWKKPRSIFISSMGDLFHESVRPGCHDQIMHMVHGCPQHTFIILTKRPGRMKAYFDNYMAFYGSPAVNLILGVSAEDQTTADERIRILLQIPAAKRFVSIEPMIGPVDLTRLIIKQSDALERGKPDVSIDSLGGWYGGAVRGEVTLLDGVIIGGESGGKARQLHPEWVRAVRDQCSGVPFMFKQWGKNVVSEHGRPWEYQAENGFPLLDGRIHSDLAW